MSGEELAQVLRDLLSQTVVDLKATPPMTDAEIQKDRSEHPDEYVQCEMCGRWDECSPCDACYNDPILEMHRQMREEK